MTKEEANKILGIENEEEPIYPKEGMIVRVVRGTWKEYRHNGSSPSFPVKEKGCHDYAIWIAGNVPVGEMGRIVRKRVFPEDHPNDSTILAIDFFNIKPKKEHCVFGIGSGPLSDQFEVVEVVV